MQARIFQPAKTATQSGRASRDWVLEFEPKYRREVEALMGWTATRDMDRELKLKFPAREAAEAFAKKRGVSYTVDLPRERRVRPKSYADNFRFDRIEARAGQSAPLFAEVMLPKPTRP
ncbi:MAG: ETC complex I subunit [Alphaproteobacteria bacterium]|nr:ETC complex I subunit [Alphaproteobacteria bacterium]MBM4437743.1 ETC complex I subunit [Actinomycetota bacterium]